MLGVSAAERIITRLAEYIGPQAARSTINMFCRRVGVLPDALSASQLSLMLPSLKPMLQILLGTTRAETVMRAIEKELAS